ncbi:MAG: universal stress protein [Cyclobacteriaceae bacterium]
MTEKSRILVGIDLSETDEYLLKFLRILSPHVDFEKIYLFHIHSLKHIPDKIKNKYLSDNVPEDESIRASLKILKEKYFDEADQKKVEVEVRDGNPEKDMLRWTRSNNIDLLILGKKPDSSGSGKLAKKMVNLADASVLLIPKVKLKKTETIYVALDHSEVSIMAIKIAIDLAKKIGAKIICHHVYRVPSGYHTSGKSYEEFAEIMRKNAEEQTQEMLKDMAVGDAKLNFEYSLDKDDDPAKVIASFSKDLQPDIVFIGSKGRTAAASLLLGSVAEKCLDYITQTPVYVVKKEGDNLDFIDMILKL